MFTRLARKRVILGQFKLLTGCVVIFSFRSVRSSSAAAGGPRADQRHLVTLFTCCPLPHHLTSICALCLPLADASSSAYSLPLTALTTSLRLPVLAAPPAYLVLPVEPGSSSLCDRHRQFSRGLLLRTFAVLPLPFHSPLLLLLFPVINL